MSDPIIAIEGLSKSYGDFVAVRDLSLSINRGEIFGFLGANGAGKTTTMRMLCGLLRPTAGKATLDGMNVWRDRYRARRKFGYMAQKFSLYPDLTVLENMRFFAGAYGVPRHQLGARIKTLLRQMDLLTKRDNAAGSLSGGMRQLLALGCALVHEPPLLFLDEPTSGLDPVHRQQMWDLLYELSHSGITIFVTTHYMDEAERCTEVGFLHNGLLLAKASPRVLKETFKARLLELDARPAMDALIRLREASGILGVSLRSGSLRIYAPEADRLLTEWQQQWPYPDIELLAHRWAEPDMEDVFTAYSQGYDAMLKRKEDCARLRASLRAINSVAEKEFIHIYRDWRILVLLLILPPVFTLIFGHAFETTGSSNVPALLEDRDQSPQSAQFVRQLSAETTFQWKMARKISGRPDLLRDHVQAALIIPTGWGASLKNGDPISLPLYLDGSDTNTASELEGRIQESLGTFQKKSLENTIETLPEEVLELGKQLPLTVRKEFVSALSRWGLKTQVLYNPEQRFIQYVIPGVIGIILQLLTVTLTACTIARERESGTLYQLMVTSLRRNEIVIGKILPYLAISILLILVIIVVAGWHFHVQFHQYHMLALICLLFLLCSLGLGLLISAFSRTQTQAIQLSVFFLLPIFVLSGAFAPLELLPPAIRYLSEIFPLTHFCRAFRLVNLYRAGPSFYSGDLIFLFVGAIVTFVGAAFLLKRIQE